jgi:hypothetical protein
MKVGAFVVLLAVGCASQHDTGRRLEIDVVAPSKLDAAVIAEATGNQIVAENEYCYVKRVRPIRHTPPKPSLALALAA